MKSSQDWQGDGFKNELLQRFAHLSFDAKIRLIAEHLRQQTIVEIERNSEICVNKQELINSISVVRGAREGQYLVISQGDYGRNLEYGTRNSLELPWFIPAFVTIAGSIDKCLQGALKRAVLKTRRPHDSK